jgi:hypothetical protein
MHLELKEGWWDYFFSGLCAGSVIWILIASYHLSQIEMPTPEQTLLIIIALLFFAISSVATFIRGCKTKK